MAGRLDGRVALVTGGASGIGRASSILFAREGAKVVAFDRSAEVEEPAAPIMRERGKGSIICTASVAGLRSGAGPSPYSASKAGVINLVQTACQELTGSGVRVNAICPGLIETGMTQPLFEKARAAGKGHKLGQLNPLQRAGVPDEIAHAALFLASDDASYVNGQAIVVDGGLSSSHPFTPSRSGSGGKL